MRTLETNGHKTTTNNGDNGSPRPHLHVPSPNASDLPPIKLTAIIGILWRRLWLIILCTLLAGLGGWIYVRNVTPMYKSTARLFVDRTGPVIVSKSVDNDMLLQTNNFRRTQAEIIKSLSVLSRVKDNPAYQSLRQLSTASKIPSPSSWKASKPKSVMTT